MKKIIVLTALSMLLFACGSSFGAATETPTATEDLAATEAAVVEATEAALAVKASEEALATVEAMSQKTATAQVRQTESANLKITRTAEVVLKMTAAAEPYHDELVNLYENGYITHTDAVFFPIDDYQVSWAQINWYRFYLTDYSPSNFVFSTELRWVSASETANWFNSGCGIVFRANEDYSDYYIVWLTLDGYVDFQRRQNGELIYTASEYYGRLDVPAGGAHLTISAEDDIINVFVNGEHVLRRSDSAFTDGELGQTTLSGTNKDFGTSCTMTETALWDLDASSSSK